MGIRLDQLHSEVFNKIGTDISAQSSEILDYLDNKIAEIDVVFGLPETTHVERDVEINKRNLEKSGFIEINRNFVPFRTGAQASTGVWVSNLSTNESPFEPRTIDGQKRGISVAGHILNYTAGNIGQNIDKMMKLPIAPNLPVFFPEDNDMVMEFNPSKVVVHAKTITDAAIDITITKRITDEYKLDINKIVEGDTTQYYYLDDESNVYYLTESGRSYLQTKPSVLLVESYNRFNETFANIFSFEKIYDFNAMTKYIDITTNKLFEIKTPVGANAVKVDLKYNNNQVYLEDIIIGQNTDGTDIIAKKLVNYSIQDTELNGLKNQILAKNIISEMDFALKSINLDNVNHSYIQDGNIKMFVSTSELYYYNPYRTYELDVNGDRVIDSITKTERLVIDELYKTYLPVGAKPTTFNTSGEPIISVVDNITNISMERTIHSVTKYIISYYRIDTMMDGDTNNVVLLDENGKLNPLTQTQNVYRPVTITMNGQLSATMTGTLVGTTVLSSGKEFYHYPLVGTKYYKKTNGDIYFIDSLGTLYTPTNDVQELFLGNVKNSDTNKTITTMIYGSKGLMYYVDSENLRTYIADETKQLIQLTDVNGYKVFEKADHSKVYVVSSTKMVTIDSTGKETTVNLSYDLLMPIFETKSVEESVLNLIIPVSFNIVQGNVVLRRNGNELFKYNDYNVEATLRLLKDLEFNEETNIGDTLYIKRAGKKDIILRMEKKGSLLNDISGHWLNNTGDIVMPEPLTGNSFNWTEGQSLVAGEQLDYNDVVKGADNKYYKYTGTALSYEDMGIDKSIIVNPTGIFWEDITEPELEYERKGQNYKIFNLNSGETIRFTITRRVWEQHPITGEMSVIVKDPYIIEKIANQDGMNLFVLNDQNFLIDDNASLESYILVIENIKYYSTYTNNRANNFRLMLTGLQTVAKNEETSMIYSQDYFLSDNIIYLNSGFMGDHMVLTRIQAPQAELKIEFISEIEQPKVTVPFEIIKNKYDVVLPKVIGGHEYTWLMGETLPEGKVLQTGDVIFDRQNIKFYKYIASTKGVNIQEGTNTIFKPTLRETLLRQSELIQKEILRQYFNIAINLNAGEYWDEFDLLWSKNAMKISDKDKIFNISYFVADTNGKLVLNISDEKVMEYLNKARVE